VRAGGVGVGVGGHMTRMSSSFLSQFSRGTSAVPLKLW
jgi:hypothetical protein